MQIATLWISISAFFLSAFSFYWVYLRRESRFLLIPINRIFSSELEFALTNTGTEEVLLVSVFWGMQGEDLTSKLHPKQKNKLMDGSVFNLEPGKSYRIESKLDLEEMKKFALEAGEVDDSSSPIGKKVKLILSIAWVDYQRGVLNGEVEFMEYSFTPNGCRASSPVLKIPIDLYKIAESPSGVF